VARPPERAAGYRLAAFPDGRDASLNASDGFSLKLERVCCGQLTGFGIDPAVLVDRYSLPISLEHGGTAEFRFVWERRCARRAWGLGEESELIAGPLEFERCREWGVL